MEQQGTTSLSIGIEIGGTKTQVGVGSAEKGLLPNGIVRRQVKRELGAQGILNDIACMVDEVLEGTHLELSDIRKIGIGYGGLLDSARGMTLKSYQIDGWTDFPLKDWAEEKWGRPVFLENDASTAGLAESMLGAGRGCSRLFYITAGSGCGGGWIVDGKVDSGQGLGAAEIGHMWMPDPETGVLTEFEQLCSGWAIGVRARRAAAEADSVMERVAGSLERIDARIVYESAGQGDEIAIRILRETCQVFGAGIANVVSLLHPQRVVLGGGVSLMGPLFWDALQREFRARLMPAFAPHVELVPAQLKEDVVVIGALCLG